MDNQAVDCRIWEAVGGQKNVKSLTHYVMWLRLRLKDESLVNTQELKEDPDVIQAVQSGGQYQVVTGSSVVDAYQSIADEEGLTVSEDGKEKSKNVLNRLIGTVSSIFTPFLGVTTAAGILKGFLSLTTVIGWLTADSGTYQILSAAADGVFTFLLVMLAFTATRKFKANQFLAVAIAVVLVYPAIPAVASAGEAISFSGIPVTLSPSGYASSVIPIILAVWVQSKLEPFVKKVIPQFLQMVLVPLVVLVVMVPLIFLALGPIGTVTGDVLGGLLSSIYGFSPAVAGLIMGSSRQVFVMFGMHWGFIPIMLLNIEQYGFDVLMPMLPPAILTQGGAAPTVALWTKDTKLRALGISSTVTLLFGITGPTAYGVTLPLKKLFTTACISGGIGGVIVRLSEVKALSSSLVSLLMIPTFINTVDGVESNVTVAVIAIGIASVLAFVGTLILGSDERIQDNQLESEHANTGEPTTLARHTLKSLLTGKVLPLNEVPGQAFFFDVIGKGIAIDPGVRELVVPADGKVTTIFPTGHAVGVTTTDGTEVLTHIGMDVVELNGNGFEILIKQKDLVQAGSLLIRLDVEAIRAAGCSIIIPVVITDTGAFADILELDWEEIIVNEDVLAIVK